MIRQTDQLLKFLLTSVVILSIAFSSATQLIAAERRTLWESRDQFVALEPRESSAAGEKEVNNHPAKIEIASILALLGAIKLQPTAASETTPLFTKESLQTMAPYLQQGLQQATADEDVTFAIIGLYSALAGLTRQPLVTTGRFFIKDGRYNLIIGLAHHRVNERADRRLDPFTPGSRLASKAGEWRLQLPAKSPGITLFRKDWVSADISWQPAEERSPEHPAPSSSNPPARSPLTVAERLTILNDLKNKGLISDDEYRKKRSDVLQEL
ncbi:MAG: SHOCT domain-containing protein [Geobacter sp.]|nr:SHOCT domain-containing protein [Geobacter sp.]